MSDKSYYEWLMKNHPHDAPLPQHTAAWMVHQRALTMSHVVLRPTVFDVHWNMAIRDMIYDVTYWNRCAR